MKIRLIEPEPPSVHIMSPWRYPRLGLPMIGAALKAAGHDVRIYCTDMAPVDWDDVAGADLVGLSTTTSTAPAGYAMADRLRGLGVPTVMGGAHVTFMADEALDHVDYVARGEGGDSLIFELIEAMHGDRESGLHPRPFLPARRPCRAQRAPRRLPGPRRATGAGSHADRRP